MKDFISYALSSMALFLSAGAFIFTVVIQKKERRRGLRQRLTTTLNDIARVNVEVAKLKKDGDAGPDIIAIWRNYNSQRNILITDADFLIHENSKLLTSIDCSLMATTYDDTGNFEKAEYYWKECIAKSENKARKHINIRDYASFLFHRNKIEEGRKEFHKAIKIKFSDTDDDWLILVDTYVIWAKLEHAFDDEKEFKHVLQLAYETCKNIKHKEKNAELKLQIDIADGKKK